MRGSRPSFVDTVSLTGRSMVIFSHRHRLGSDPQWLRSDYPLLRAIIDWCSVCRSSEGQPTWKLLGERRPVGHWPSMVPPGRAPTSGSPREPRLPRTSCALKAFGRGTATADGYRRRRAGRRGRKSRRCQGFLYRVRIPSRPSCASLTPPSPFLYF